LWGRERGLPAAWKGIEPLRSHRAQVTALLLLAPDSQAHPPPPGCCPPAAAAPCAQAIEKRVADTSRYAYVIFLNSSVRGPFLPPYFPVRSRLPRAEAPACSHMPRTRGAQCAEQCARLCPPPHGSPTSIGPRC
jgi:hypothetical protein